MFVSGQYDAALDKLDDLDAAIKRLPNTGNDNIANNHKVICGLISLLRDSIGLHALLVKRHERHPELKD